MKYTIPTISKEEAYTYLDASARDDFYNLAGDRNAITRAAILTAVTGQKWVKSKASITSLQSFARDEFYRTGITAPADYCTRNLNKCWTRYRAEMLKTRATTIQHTLQSSGEWHDYNHYITEADARAAMQEREELAARYNSESTTKYRLIDTTTGEPITDEPQPDQEETTVQTTETTTTEPTPKDYNTQITLADHEPTATSLEVFYQDAAGYWHDTRTPSNERETEQTLRDWYEIVQYHYPRRVIAVAGGIEPNHQDCEAYRDSAADDPRNTHEDFTRRNAPNTVPVDSKNSTTKTEPAPEIDQWTFDHLRDFITKEYPHHDTAILFHAATGCLLAADPDERKYWLDNGWPKMINAMTDADAELMTRAEAEYNAALDNLNPREETPEPATEPRQLDILAYTPDDEPEPTAPNTAPSDSKIVTIDRRQFADALAAAARAAVTKSSLPILESARITAQGDRVTVTCTDLDTATRATVPADARAELDICVPAKVLQEYLKQAPDGPIQIGEDTIEGCSDGSATLTRPAYPGFTIAAGTSKFQPANTAPCEDFPEVPAIPSDAPTITTSAAELAAALTKLLPIAKRGTKDAGRSLFACLDFQYTDNRFQITATDGKTMATEPIQGSAAQNCAVIIHHDAAQQWQKMAANTAKLDPGATVTIRIGRDNATLETGTVETLTRAIEGEYPKPIEFAAATTLQLDRKTLAAALRRLAKPSKSDDGRLKFQYSNGLLQITTDEVTAEEHEYNEDGEVISTTPGTRETAAREEVPASDGQPSFLQYVNHKLLTDTLKGEKADIITLDYGTATSSECKAKPIFRLNGCLVMPTKAPDNCEEPTAPQHEERAPEVITVEEVAPIQEAPIMENTDRPANTDDTPEGRHHRHMARRQYAEELREAERQKPTNTAEPVPPIIGDNLADERENAAWKQKELAAAQTETNTAPATYEAWVKARDVVEAAHQAAAQKLDNYPSLPNGLTPDHVKQSPQWQEEHRTERALFRNLQEINSHGTRHFKKEIHQSRRDRMAAKTAAIQEAAASAEPPAEYSDAILTRAETVSDDAIQEYLGREPRDQYEAAETRVEIAMLPADATPPYKPSSARLLASLLPDHDDAPAPDEPPSEPNEPNTPDADSEINAATDPRRKGRRYTQRSATWTPDAATKAEWRNELKNFAQYTDRVIEEWIEGSNGIACYYANEPEAETASIHEPSIPKNEPHVLTYFAAGDDEKPAIGAQCSCGDWCATVPINDDENEAQEVISDSFYTHATGQPIQDEPEPCPHCKQNHTKCQCIGTRKMEKPMPGVYEYHNDDDFPSDIPPTPDEIAREEAQWEHDQRAAEHADYIEKMAEEAAQDEADDSRHDDEKHDPTAPRQYSAAQEPEITPEIGKPCPNHPTIYQQIIELFGKPYCGCCQRYNPGTPHERDVHQEAQYQRTHGHAYARSGHYRA